MKNSGFYLLIFVLILVQSINTRIKAQSVSIETTNLEIVDKRLEINYDVNKTKKNNRFEVWVDITNTKGEKINARTFSGDLGPNIIGGKGKKIIWDYNADGIVLDEEVEIVVVAKMSNIVGSVSTGKCFLQSMIMPGMGISSIEKNKPFWLLGIAGYASLGSSIYLRSSYKSNYEKYLTALDQQEQTDYYNKSQSQKELSNILVYTAIGTWTVSAIWTLIRAKQHNASIASNTVYMRFKLYSAYDPVSKKPLLGLRYNF